MLQVCAKLIIILSIGQSRVCVEKVHSNTLP